VILLFALLICSQDFKLHNLTDSAAEVALSLQLLDQFFFLREQ